MSGWKKDECTGQPNFIVYWYQCVDCRWDKCREEPVQPCGDCEQKKLTKKNVCPCNLYAHSWVKGCPYYESNEEK